MLKKLFLPLLLIVGSLGLQAQEHHQMSSEQHQQKHEQIKAQKISYITEKLSLTTTEAEQFWPIYNEMESKMHDNRKARRELRRDKKLDEMSDAEVETMVDGMIRLEQEELDLKKAFHLQVKQVLPIKKVALLYKAERQFRKELLHKMKGNQKHGQH